MSEKRSRELETKPKKSRPHELSEMRCKNQNQEDGKLDQISPWPVVAEGIPAIVQDKSQGVFLPQTVQRDVASVKLVSARVCCSSLRCLPLAVLGVVRVVVLHHFLVTLEVVGKHGWVFAGRLMTETVSIASRSR